MESFAIIIQGSVYVVKPQVDETFIIMQGGDKLGLIYPDSDIDMEAHWWTSDVIPLGLARTIGEAIDRYEQ